MTDPVMDTAPGARFGRRWLSLFVVVAIGNVWCAWRIGGQAFGMTYDLRIGTLSGFQHEMRKVLVRATGPDAIGPCPVDNYSRQKLLGPEPWPTYDWRLPTQSNPVRWGHTDAGFEVWLYDCTLTASAFDGGSRADLIADTDRLLCICLLAFLISALLVVFRLAQGIIRMIARIVPPRTPADPRFARAVPAHLERPTGKTPSGGG